MLLREIFSPESDPDIQGAGWLHLGDHRWVAVPDGLLHSHASEVALNPHRFGLDPAGDAPACLRDLWDTPDWQSYRADHRVIRRLDGDPDLMAFMGRLGWVRVIHHSVFRPQETNIQAGTLGEVRRAAGWLYDQGGGITTLYFDLGGDDKAGVRLTGDTLMRFLAGRYRPAL
jgi:hypothetical protein